MILVSFKYIPENFLIHKIIKLFSSIIGDVNKTVFFFTKHILNLKTHKTITSN